MIIPILTYHGLSKQPESNRYTLTERDFSNHLELLSEIGFKTIASEELIHNFWDRCQASSERSERNVMITFDDGHETDYSIALPLLKKFGFNATFFITTDWIGKKGYMNGFQLKELKTEGMSVQSHSKSHRLLDELSRVDIELEMNESKKKLEDILGSEVSFLAFPGGRYNQEVIKCGNELRFSCLFSSLPFFFEKTGQTFLAGRYNVKRSGLSDFYFKKFINSNALIRSIFSGSYQGKFYLKKLLGNRLYYLLWKKYIGKS